MTEISLVLGSATVLPSERAQLYSRARRGELVAITRGCWVRAETWNALDDAARHKVLCRAVQATRSVDFIFSHQSAVALWNLPWFGDWPQKAHTLFVTAGSGRSTSQVVRHGRAELPSPALIDGLLVTPLISTVVDVASTATFESAVVVADAALRVLTRDAQIDEVKTAMHHEVHRIALTHGRAKAERAIDFADPRADRPGESLSRVSILRAGLTAPDLQVQLRGASGNKYTVDFYWPEFNVIGEFDGKAKYTDPAFLRGRTAEQAVYDEKLREDDLRAMAHGFARWKWSTALSPVALGALLRHAGVR